MPPTSPYPPERLAPYDPRWAERYISLAGDLNRGLGPGWTVEHVGSTSVPGLLAKPVIDLAIRVPDGNNLRHWVEVFHGLGWNGPGALVRNGIWGRDYTEAKRDFVEEVVNRARAARGLAAITL